MLRHAHMRKRLQTLFPNKNNIQQRELLHRVMLVANAERLPVLNIARAAREGGEHYGTARYWWLKKEFGVHSGNDTLMNQHTINHIHKHTPTSGRHGGHRYQTMTLATQFHFEWTLFSLYDEDQSLTINEYVIRLRAAGVFWLTMGAGSKRVERLLKKWNITRKKASVTSPLKYRTELIIQRFDYLDWVTRQRSSGDTLGVKLPDLYVRKLN